MKLKLPASQLTLPGGFCISISYKTDKQCKRNAGTAVYGYWEQRVNGGRIILNRDMPLWRQTKTFGHELVHAINDYSHWLDRQADFLKEEGEKTIRELEEGD